MDTPLDLERIKSASATADAVPVGSRRRVLLVDDEDSILRALQRLLRREPYDLATANSGEEALRMLEQHPTHLVITDQRMPGMTGVELLQRVRQRWPDVIRIVLSGYTKVNTIIEAINDGAVYKYLTKPWNDEELKLHLRRALEQYELEAENVRLTEQVLQQNERLLELNKVMHERALDAAIGLSSWQTMLESLRVGVFAIDENGLIVAANRRAMELVAATPEFVGNPAGTAVCAALHSALNGAGDAASKGESGRCELKGRACQWHRQPLGEGVGMVGTVLTIWEEVT